MAFFDGNGWFWVCNFGLLSRDVFGLSAGDGWEADGVRNDSTVDNETIAEGPLQLIRHEQSTMLRSAIRSSHFIPVVRVYIRSLVQFAGPRTRQYVKAEGKLEISNRKSAWVQIPTRARRRPGYHKTPRHTGGLAASNA